MKTIISPKRSTKGLIASAAAIALAVGPMKRSKWRYPLYSMGGLALAKSILDAKHELDDVPAREQAPALVRCEKVDGILMRWEEHGGQSDDAFPIVMVHGLPTNPRVWRYVIPPLVRSGARCLAWEQIGFGGSMQAGLDKDLSIPKQAQYLYRFLKHKGIDKAIFVGHDYGGGVIQQLLVDHPEMAAGVVLCDSVAFKNWPVPAVRLAQAMGPALKLLPPALIKPFLFAAVCNLHSTRSVDSDAFETYWSPYNRSLGPWALSHQLKFFRNEDTEAVGLALEHAKLRIPAKVLWGEKDPLGIPSAERLASALGAGLLRVPGGRHFTIEDHPRLVAGVIESVLLEAQKHRR